MSLRSRMTRVAYGRGPWVRVVRRLRPRGLVLLYHRVADPAFDPFGLSVPPKLFADHLAALRRHFTPTSLEALLEGLGGGGAPDGGVAVTFDDGYADNLYRAQPIAAAQDVPLTFFVTAGPVLEGKPFWWDELARAVEGLRGRPPFEFQLGAGGRVSLGGDTDPTEAVRALHRRLMESRDLHTTRGEVIDRLLEASQADSDPAGAGRPLTASELLELADCRDVVIGAHSITHPSLGRLHEADQLFELDQGRKRLEATLGRPVTLLAYPFGQPRDVDQSTMRLARRVGYRAAFTTTEGVLTGRSIHRRPYALARITVDRASPVELVARLQAILQGG